MSFCREYTLPLSGRYDDPRFHATRFTGPVNNDVSMLVNRGALESVAECEHSRVWAETSVSTGHSRSEYGDSATGQRRAECLGLKSHILARP
jgi:hypothetical protein